MATQGRSRRQASLPTRIVISWLVNAIILAVVVAVVPHAHEDGLGSLLIAAAVFGVLNTFLKPALRFLAAPLALLTFGIAWFFVSLLMLVLTQHIVGGFHIGGFWNFVFATAIIWVINLILDLTPGPWQLTGNRRRRQHRAA